MDKAPIEWICLKCLILPISKLFLTLSSGHLKTCSLESARKFKALSPKKQYTLQWVAATKPYVLQMTRNYYVLKLQLTEGIHTCSNKLGITVSKNQLSLRFKMYQKPTIALRWWSDPCLDASSGIQRLRNTILNDKAFNQWTMLIWEPGTKIYAERLTHVVTFGPILGRKYCGLMVSRSYPFLQFANFVRSVRCMKAGRLSGPYWSIPNLKYLVLSCCDKPKIHLLYLYATLWSKLQNSYYIYLVLVRWNHAAQKQQGGLVSGLQ